MIERPVQFWELPGPKRYLAGVCRSAYNGTPVLVEDPWEPAGIAEAIERQLWAEGVLRVISLANSKTCRLADAVAGATGLRLARPAILAQAPELRDTVLIASTERESREWIADLEAIVRARSVAADPKGVTLIAVALPSHKLWSDGIWEERPARGLLGSWDTAARAAATLAGDASIGRRVAMTVACQVGAWDLDLVDRLAALPLEKGMRPEKTLTDWVASEIERWRQVPRSWRHGTVDVWDGEIVTHALWLAANEPSSLGKRVWRGQVAALLPWIEETRCRVITLCQRILRPSAGEPGRPATDIEGLDWGPLLLQLSEAQDTTPGWVLRLARHMRRVRNELAHGRPATWPAIKDCLDAWREWGDELAKAANRDRSVAPTQRSQRIS